jgi:hypothetical protein
VTRLKLKSRRSGETDCPNYEGSLHYQVGLAAPARDSARSRFGDRFPTRGGFAVEMT